MTRNTIVSFCIGISTSVFLATTAAAYQTDEPAHELELVVLGAMLEPISGKKRVEIEYSLVSDPVGDQAEPRFKRVEWTEGDTIKIELEKGGIRYFYLTCLSDGKVGHKLFRYGQGGPGVALELSQETIIMDRGRAFRGSVVDHEGNPVAGVQISVDLHPQEYPEQRKSERFEYTLTQSDTVGGWQVEGFPVENTAPEFAKAEREMPRLIFDHPDFPGPVYVTSPPEKMRVTLPRSATISGTVTDNKGNPVADATVRFADNVWAPHVPTAVTNRDGKYQVKGCWPGAASLSVEADGFGPQTSTVEVSVGKPLSADFKLESTKPFEGRVVNSNGQPLSGAIVRCSNWQGLPVLRWETLTDDQGNFAWSSPPAGEVALQVISEDHLIVSNHVIDTRQPSEDIKLWPVFTVSGRVVDANEPERSLPVHRVGFGWARPDGSPPNLIFGNSKRDLNWISTGIDPDHSAAGFAFRFEHMASKYGIRVQAPGYLSWNSEDIDYRIGDTSRLVELVPSDTARGNRYDGWSEIEARIEAGEFDMAEVTAMRHLRETGALIGVTEWEGVRYVRVQLIDEHVVARLRGGATEVRREPERKVWQGTAEDLHLLDDLGDVILTLDGWQINSALLTELSRCGDIYSLHLRGVWQLQGAEFSALDRLTNVRDMIIEFPLDPFPAEGLEALSRLPNLEGLSFRRNRPSPDAVVEFLGKFPKLNKIGSGLIRDHKVLRDVEMPESLESLHVDCDVDDKTLAWLPDRPQMKTLYLRHSDISDEGLMWLRNRYPNLGFLDLGSLRLSRAGMRFLSQRPWPGLYYLQIPWQQRRDLVDLQRAHPNCRIALSSRNSLSYFQLRTSEYRAKLDQ